MPETPYSNREINEWRTDVKDTLTEILIQTRKTNGRVRSLEVWRGVIVGGLAVVTTLVIPILFAVLTHKI